MKLNSNQNLFTSKLVDCQNELYKVLDKELKKFYKVERLNRDKIYQIIAKTMLDYDIQDKILVLNKVQYAELHNKLKVQIQNIIQEEIKQENELFEKLLKDMTLDMYNYNQYLYSVGIDFNLKVISQKQLNKIINTKIADELWSNRLWDNKNDLKKILQLKIDQFLNGKINVNDIKKEVASVYNNNAFEIKRLTETETSRVMEQSNELFAKENGEYQLFMATLDKRTSEKCRLYDGKTFSVNDVNKPVPPLHPFCRSTLCLIPSKDWKPNKRRDNENKIDTDYKTFKTWAVEQGLE